MVIIQKSSGTWWKCLLSFFGGIIFTIAATAGAAVAAGTIFKTGELLGSNANILRPQYQQKTVWEIIQEAMGGKLKFQTYGDIDQFTPAVSDVVDQINGTLSKEFNFELDKEAFMEFQVADFSGLSSYLVNAIKSGVNLAGLLHADTSDDDLLKYLCYATRTGSGTTEDPYVYSDPVTVAQMMDDSNFFRNKVNGMKLGDILKDNDNKALAALSNKTILELQEADAFDDILIEDVMDIGPSSPKILRVFAEKDVTIGGMSEAIDELEVKDVIEYDDYDTLPQVMKKFIGNEGPTVEVLGPSYIATIDWDNYDEFIIQNALADEDVTEKTDILAAKSFYLKETISLSKDGEGHYNAVGSGVAYNEKNETFNIIVNKPDAWDHMYVKMLNKPIKASDINTAVEEFRLKDVVKIDPGSPLEKVKNCEVKDGNALFDKMKATFTVRDIFPDADDNKFLKSIADEKLDNLGAAVNNISVLDAFDDDIFSGSGDDAEMNATWKYLLLEPLEKTTLLSKNAYDKYTRGADPFNKSKYVADPSNAGTIVDGKYVFKCNTYTIGGSMSKMIDNMQHRMENEPIQNLARDGIMTFSDDTFLTTDIPSSVHSAAGLPPETTKFGQLSTKELVEVLSKVNWTLIP